jgi:hypothetical protein
MSALIANADRSIRHNFDGQPNVIEARDLQLEKEASQMTKIEGGR